MPELPMDQAHDPLGEELYRLDSLYTPPAWVKAAAESALKGDDDMPGRCYADPVGRRYPVHTAAATWMSTAYFLEKSAALAPAYRDRVGRTLIEMADYWSIRGPVDDLAEKVAEAHGLREAPLPDAAFALVESNDGQVSRSLPLRNAEEVKAAAAWLVRYRDEFPIDDRRTIAAKVMAKAAAFAADLGAAAEDVDRMAGLGGCTSKAAADAIDSRASLLARRDPATADGLRELASAVRGGEVDAVDPDLSRKLARALDEADRAHGLGVLYGDGLERPEDVLYAVTEKRAAAWAADLVATATGATYGRGQLAEVRDLAGVRDYMGDGFADAVAATLGGRVDATKLAAALSAATEADAASFDRLMADGGRPPLGKLAAARPRRPTLAEIVALA